MDEEYKGLTHAQQLFLDTFKATHDYKKALATVPRSARQSVSRSLHGGSGKLYELYQKFINSNPLPPEATKTVQLNRLLHAQQLALDENDTMMVLKMAQEINKMVKGNLASTTVETKTTNTFVAVYDLTGGNAGEIGEGKIIDITPNEDG
jgi:hypothetical protein